MFLSEICSRKKTLSKDQSLGSGVELRFMNQTVRMMRSLFMVFQITAAQLWTGTKELPRALITKPLTLTSLSKLLNKVIENLTETS